MVSELLTQPDRVDEIVSAAVGCVVTREEHERLSAIDREFPELVGWKRYVKAGLVVRDMESGTSTRFSVASSTFVGCQQPVATKYSG